MKTKKLLLTLLILILTLQPAFAQDTGELQEPVIEAPEDTAAEEPVVEESNEVAQGEAFGAPSGPEAGISGFAMPFLQESFQTDLATGAATMSIPITLPPGRKNLQPNIALSYSSNNSNDICGVGWSIPTSAIQRSTKKGVPAYDNTKDTFIFGGAELMSINDENTEYRAKIEGAFMRYTFNDNSWTVFDKSGAKYFFGETPESRLEKSPNTFAWYLTKVLDVYGNYITYSYIKPEDGQIYLDEISYTGGTDLEPNKSIKFIYEARTDKLFSYRTGWNITTSQRLSFIEVKLNDNIVWKYKLDYIESTDTGRSLLKTITVYDKDGASLPPKEFTYQKL